MKSKLGIVGLIVAIFIGGTPSRVCARGNDFKAVAKIIFTWTNRQLQSSYENDAEVTSRRRYYMPKAETKQTTASK